MPPSFQFTATQTPETLTFEVRIPVGVTPQSLSVTVTDVCVTVSSAQSYVTNIDLADTVQLETARCKFAGGYLTIQVLKVNQGMWNSIQFSGPQEEALKRREESYTRYDEYVREKTKQEAIALAAEKRRQIDADIEERQRQAAEERKKRENEILKLQQQVANYTNEVQTGAVPASTEVQLPGIRTANTVTIEASFTKRRVAVPAREGRDIYADRQLGPVVEPKSVPADEKDIKEGEHKRKLSPYELLDQGKKLATRGIGADLPTAMEIAGQVREQLPLNMDAIVLYTSISLKEGRYEQALEATDAGLTVLEGKHPLQKNKENQVFSNELQSRMHALRGAALAQAKRLREASTHMDKALKLNPENAALARDARLLQRIVTEVLV